MYHPDCQKALITLFPQFGMQLQMSYQLVYLNFFPAGKTFKCYCSKRYSMTFESNPFVVMKHMNKYMQLHHMNGLPYRCRYTVQTPGGPVLPQCAGQ